MKEIDLKNYEGFCFLKKDDSWERTCISLTCAHHNIPNIGIDIKDPLPKGFIPSGSVEWCLKCLGKNIIPNYYPKWASEHLYRKVWKTDKWPLGKRVFIKPANKYKRFDGFVTTGSYKKKKKPPYRCSDIVQFTNEWRYYISEGIVLAAEWYAGDEINTPEAPFLDIHIPKDFYGTLDFGRMPFNKFALVEAHHPFSCGWYGKQHELYVQWLIDGWYHLQNKIR
jgi:hypothetical protein